LALGQCYLSSRARWQPAANATCWSKEVGHQASQLVLICAIAFQLQGSLQLASQARSLPPSVDLQVCSNMHMTRTYQAIAATDSPSDTAAVSARIPGRAAGNKLAQLQLPSAFPPVI